jgi:hypothetical protein
MAKKDNLSEKEKQKIKDDYNALYEDSVMDVLKYSGKRELQSIADGFMPVSPEAKDKARAKRSLEFSIDDEKIINLVQTLKSKLNNIPAELREDAAKQMTRENTSPENYLPFYNLITQQGDYGPEGSKSIKYFEPNINAESLGREIRSQETLPVPIPFEVGAVIGSQKTLPVPIPFEVGAVIGSQKTLPLPKNMGGLIGYAQGGNMSIQQQTQNVANQGRYGDSMLLHVNPAEVKGLAQAMPITVNPETGQPEAFLPFLAPLLGSMGMTALAGTGIGATLGLSGLSAGMLAGLGAGLGTYAQTGGSGSKALLSGLTAGFGTSAMNTAAPAVTASAAIPATTPIVGSAGAGGGFGASTGTLATGGSGAGAIGSDIALSAVTPTAAPSSFFDAGKRMFTQGPKGAFNFDAGAKSLANAAMTPSGMLAGTALGGSSIINSQELYEQQMRQLEEDEEQRRRDMYANNPEVQLYSASGGTTNFEGGGLLEKTLSGDYGVLGILKNNPELAFGAAGLAAKNNFRGSFLGELYNKYKERKSQGDEQGANEVASQIQQEESNQMAYGGMTNFARGGDTDFGYESNRQVYAPAKQQYAVNPDFMAGFAPETMYFRPDTINAPSSSTRGGSRPTLGPDTYTGTKGGYDYEGTVDADGNYTAGTAQGVQFAPQTSIDPYAAFTGSAPQGLVQSAYNPYPAQPMSMSPIDDTEDTSDYGGIDGDFYAGNPDFDFSFYNATDSAGNPLTGSPYGPYDQDAVDKIRDQYKDYFFDYNDIQDFYRDEMTGIGRKAGGVTNYANQGQIEMMSPPTNDFRQDPITQEVIAFLMGDSENTEVVEMFVDKYGNETFMALREMILNPDGTKQTEGLIAGVGNGGMDDDLLGSIGNKEKIAVSQDEFIIPADVVSGLGDGSSNAGSKELYAMMDRIRQKRTGTTKQPTMLANAGGLLPA